MTSDPDRVDDEAIRIFMLVFIVLRNGRRVGPLSISPSDVKSQQGLFNLARCFPQALLFQTIEVLLGFKHINKLFAETLYESPFDIFRRFYFNVACLVRLRLLSKVCM